MEKVNLESGGFLTSIKSFKCIIRYIMYRTCIHLFEDMDLSYLSIIPQLTEDAQFSCKTALGFGVFPWIIFKNLVSKDGISGEHWCFNCMMLDSCTFFLAIFNAVPDPHIQYNQQNKTDNHLINQIQFVILSYSFKTLNKSCLIIMAIGDIQKIAILPKKNLRPFPVWKILSNQVVFSSYTG